MKIFPMPNCVYIRTQKQKVGAFDTSMRDSAVEYAEVIAVGDYEGRMGDNLAPLKVGDKIFVKSWGIDIIDFDGERYEFCNLDTNAILCKVTNG